MGVMLWLIVGRDNVAVEQRDAPPKPVVKDTPGPSEPEEGAVVPLPVVEAPAAKTDVEGVAKVVDGPPATTPAEIPQEAGPEREGPPLLPDHAPDEPAINVEAQLSLRLAEFTLTRPAPVRLLLLQLAELSAVPIDFREVEVERWRSRLDQPIAFELKETTLAAVLEEILRQSGLTQKRGAGVIEILPPEAN